MTKQEAINKLRGVAVSNWDNAAQEYIPTVTLAEAIAAIEEACTTDAIVRKLKYESVEVYMDEDAREYTAVVELFDAIDIVQGKPLRHE